MPFIETAEATIFHEQSGAGPDLVWVGGGGTLGRDWRRFQTPYFDRGFRSTTFDNRGIGQTRSTRPQPWGLADFARDAASLVEDVCAPPVFWVGNSLGAAIIQQVVVDRPDLVRCAVVMGTGAWSAGWGWDYQDAEIAYRRAGGRLDGMMGVCHYAAMLYPARALGDRELWPRLRALLLEWMDSGENEASFIPQWEASLRYDQRAALARVRVPVHVIAFAEDVQAPPQDGEEMARLIPGATFDLLEGMGHASWFGHAHDRLNPFIESLLRRHL
ncbi:MAG: alpha/beta hydrolase [Alphaproteobacteria bacterium]